MNSSAARGKTAQAYTPPEYYEHLDKLKALVIGDTIRVCHKHKSDGSPCSIGKDNAMMITKYHGHYYFYCHRCAEQGKIVTIKSPQELAKELREQAERVERHSELKVERKIELPSDCMDMTSIHVPSQARAFLARYGITASLIKKYNIQYSPSYGRIIFPIYEFYISTKKTTDKLIGWCGRCYHPMDKEMRISRNRPKYLIRKLDRTAERMYWTRLNKDVEYTVVVEDIISAIRIHEATRINAVALLTTSIPDGLFPCFRDHIVVLWLDHDMMFKSLQYVNRLNTCGVKALHVDTVNDPKMYSAEDIAKQIGGRIVNAS